MDEYATGDIVLLSHRKLGVMTSSSTVREIHGEDTDITCIVRKLTANELADALVKLMGKYNILETELCRLKENNTDSTINTKTTASYTEQSKSSKDTSSSDLEPNPKSISNDVHIAKTPVPNHTIMISPTYSKQHTYCGQHTGTYISAKRSDGDTPNTKFNDESATTATVEVQIGTKSMTKSPKPKKISFCKTRKKKKHSKRSAVDHKYHKMNTAKAHSSRFLLKNKNRKNTDTNNKISKRSSSSETHYMRHTHAATLHHTIPTHTQHPTHEHLPYPHDAHAAHTHGPHLPFSQHKTNHHLRAPHSMDPAAETESHSNPTAKHQSSKPATRGRGQSSSEAIFCQVCHQIDPAADLLSCDGCPRYLHMECIRPRPQKKWLSVLDNWYCPSCAAYRLFKYLY